MVGLYPEFPLAGGHCSIIYSLMDGINGGLGECISYGVVHVQDMASMVALESASATGLSFSRMWNLWWPWRVHQLWGYSCPGYGIYCGPGECISYGVVHALDITSMVAQESASAWSCPRPHGECISYGVVLTFWRVHQLRGCP